MHIKAPLKVPIKAQKVDHELPSHKDDLNESFILT